MPILTGECVPAGSSFPIADINNVLGGAMQVADSTARLAIHSSRRRAGMRVWQIDTGIEYMLVGGIADENWQPITRVGAASPEASVTGCFVGHPYWNRLVMAVPLYAHGFLMEFLEQTLVGCNDIIKANT